MKQIIVNLKKCFLILFIVLLISCSNIWNNHEPTKIGINQSNPTPINPTNNLSTQTQIMSQLNPTITKLPTLLPTLPFDKAQALINEIWKINGNCVYPCWLGIRPGYSTWQDVKNFVLPLSGEIKINEFNNGAWVTIPAPDISNKGIEVFFFFPKGTIQEIIVTTPQSIRNILLNNGIPTQIWIHTGLAGYFDLVSFSIVIYYQNLGVAIKYFGEEYILEKSGDKNFARICSKTLDKNFSRMHLFSEEEVRNESDLYKKWTQNSPYDLQGHTVITEGSNMTIKSFYENFIKAIPDQCIISNLN